MSKAVKTKKRDSAFNDEVMDSALKKEDEKDNGLKIEDDAKPVEEESIEERPEEDVEDDTNKITRRRNIKGAVNNLSLRLNAEDLMAVKFLSLKRKKSIQALLVEGLNILIEEEIKRSPDDIRSLHKIK